MENALKVLDQLHEMQNAEEQQDRMNESGDTEEPHDQIDEMDDVEEDHSETRVDLEQYFDALDEERRNAEKSQEQMDQQGTDTQEPPSQSNEMSSTAEDHSESETKVDLEQYFDALDEERRNAENLQDQMDEQSTDTQEPPSQSNEMSSTAENHSESESRVDLEQYFDALDEERRNAELLGEDRMDESSDAEEEDSGPRADLEGSFEGLAGGGAGEGVRGYGIAGSSEECRGEVSEDAMVIDEGTDGHGHGDTVGHAA